MKFKQFLREEFEGDNETITKGIETIESPLSKIKTILSTMDSHELNEFGFWLYNEVFDDDNIEDDDDDDDNIEDDDDDDDDDDDFDYDEIVELITSLDSEDLSYVLYMLEDDEDDEEIDEVAVKFLAKNRNHKKNKKFTLSKAKFRAGKAARKKENRKNKIQRKKNYRRNKIKIKKYQKSYNAAVKSGKHIKKVRR